MGFMEEPIKVLPQSRPPTEATGEGERAVSERGKEGSANMCKMWINPKMARSRRRATSRWCPPTKRQRISERFPAVRVGVFTPRKVRAALLHRAAGLARDATRASALTVRTAPLGVAFAGLCGMAMVTQVKEPTSQGYPRMR